MRIQFMGLSKVCEARDRGRSSLYQDLDKQLWPEPIRGSGGKNAWPEHEVQLMLLAKLRGDTNDQIRSLVIAIVKQRNRSYNEMRAWYELRFCESGREVAA